MVNASWDESNCFGLVHDGYQIIVINNGWSIEL